MKEEKYAIEVVDLVKRYKELLAVDHLSLQVNRGETFGLLGPNGSGKTTLIHCILGLLTYNHGKITLYNQSLESGGGELRKKIGLVPQEVTVYDELTVFENIDYFCGLYIEDKKKKRALVDEAIEFAELQDFRNFLPKKLSGGLLRRLNLACGIAHKPQLIFFDEPTVAVDPQSRNKILEGIKELNKKGATIVYTSHYMEEVEMLCDRLAILDHGKVLVEGNSKEIMNMSSLAESIELTAYGISETVIKELEKKKEVVSLTYQEGKLSLVVKKGSLDLLSLLHILEKEGIEPLEISSKKPTLNDIFLEITGKDLRDHV